MSKYLIVLFFFISCKSTQKETQKNVIVFNKFPKEQKISFSNFIKFEPGIIGRIFLKDSSLIAYDWRGSGGYFFYEFNLNSGNEIGKYIPLGRGAGKALGSLSAGLEKNKLWMLDISLGKLLFAELRSNQSATDSLRYEEYPIAQDYYNIQFIDRNTIVANGNYKTEKKLQKLNVLTFKVISDFGVMEDIPDSIPLYAWKRANEGYMIIKPTFDKVAIAHRLNDQIEIFDLNSEEGKVIKGPENLKAEFSTFKTDRGEDMIGPNEKSRYGFGQINAIHDFIYVSFSGNNMRSKYLDYAKTIYVYDWNGNPVRKINLDRYICGFAVSNDNKILYAYDVVSKFIVKTEIDL